MDASNAFDRVNHWTLLKKMIDSGMPPIFVRLIVTWYCEQRACVRWGSTLSPKFNVSNGVRQGGILSPLFFNLYMDRLSVTLSETKVGCALYPRHTGGAVLLRCLYGINRSGTAMIAVVPQWFRH